METVQKELEIKKNEEFSKYQQEREIAIQKANERTETVKQRAEKEREAEQAEISSQEQIEVAKISQNHPNLALKSVILAKKTKILVLREKEKSEKKINTAL